MKRFLFLGLSSVVILAMNGCYYDNEEDLYPATFCDTANVNYSGEVDAIMQSKCAIPGCHVAGGDGSGDFTQYSEVAEKAANGSLVRSINRGANAIPMPPDAPLRECEIRQIELWVADGAPQN
ncbi:MAG: hypothetical protein JNL43_05145 [Flavobacteriales bacterium]|nr:hypothetical protein [Flavobacteriales bacterium]